MVVFVKNKYTIFEQSHIPPPINIIVVLFVNNYEKTINTVLSFKNMVK